MILQNKAHVLEIHLYFMITNLGNYLIFFNSNFDIQIC
jgi:hypothetical protein